MRELNALAAEVNVSDAAVAPKTATGTAVERLVKLLWNRLQSEAQYGRLHAAAQRWSQNGGEPEGKGAPRKKTAGSTSGGTYVGKAAIYYNPMSFKNGDSRAIVLRLANPET